MKLGSIILAGGRSRRMGQPKESLPFQDNSLLGHTVDTLLDCTFPVYVVARDTEQELPPLCLEVEFAYDQESDQGPLMGIRSGLEALQGQCDAAFVIGCDHPYLDPDSVGWLAQQLGDHDMVIVKAGDTLQPLGAIYRLSILDTVKTMLAEGIHTPKTLVDRVRARIISEEELTAFDPEHHLIRNLNSPEDYQKALRDAGSSGD